MKYLLTSAGSLAVGYFAAQLILKRKYENDVTQAVAEVQEHYREFYKQKLVEAGVTEPEESEKVAPAFKGQYVPEQDDDEEFSVDRLVRGDFSPPPPVDYNAQYRKGTVANPKPDLASPLDYVYDPEDPHVISQNAYNAGMPEWEEAQMLVYYVPDDIVADSLTGEVLSEDTLERYIRRLNLEQFGEKSLDEDTVFVRAPRVKTDFEVVRSQESYQEATGKDLPLAGGGGE